MDIVNQQFGHIRDLFVGMTPGNRIIAGLLMTVLLASLGFLLMNTSYNSTDGKYTFVFDGRTFSQTEQQSCAGAFGKTGLTGYIWEESKLKVPVGSNHKFEAAIYENKCISNGGDVAQNTVNNLSAIESGKMMDLKMVQSRASDCQKTITALSWVANTTIVPGERMDRSPRFYDNRRFFSASVTVWPLEDRAMTEKELAQVTRIVKTGLSITELNDISIINGRTPQVSMGTEEGMQGGQKSYAEAAQQFEQEWNSKIRGVLAYIPGLIVQTTVMVDDILKQSERVVEHGEKPTIVSEREQSTNFVYDGVARIGRPGYVAQWNTPEVNPANNAAAQGDHKEEKTKTTETNSALQGKEKDIERAPLTPRTIHASIQIPMRYIRSVWQKNNPTATAEPTAVDLANMEIDIRGQIQKTVANLIANYRDLREPDPTTSVVVGTYMDEPMKEPEIVQGGILSWLQDEWQTLSLLGIVFAALGVLWSVTRPRPSEPIIIYESPEMTPEMAAAMLGSGDDEEEPREETMYSRVLEPFNKTMRSLQQEVTDLVEENPDAAANVIRQWIGNVAVLEH